MAGSSLLALIDDIATLLDDVAVLTKIAAKKTSGVLGDDLALNAEQVAGVNADRELPVIWAVAKGSFKNKLILVPSALLISAVTPWLILPLLMLGGLYLCYEGFEKVFDKIFHKQKHDPNKNIIEAVNQTELEKIKIKGAIRTDFILSAEIITITLGSVAAASFTTQVLVLAGSAILFTVGVYGIVALIVKMDDFGLYLTKQTYNSSWAKFKASLGFKIINTAPYLMKALGILGTIAMFLVGGGIISHGIPSLHHFAETILSNSFLGTLFDGSIGILSGAIAFAVVHLESKLRNKQ